MAIAYSHQAQSQPLNEARRRSGTDLWFSVIFGLTCAAMFLDVQFQAAGARIRLFDIVLLSLVALYAVSIVISGRLKRTPGLDFVAAYLVVALYWILNAALLTSVPEAIKETIQTISYISFFWILTDLLGDQRRFRAFFLSFLVGIWALSLLNAGTSIARGDLYGYKQDAGSLKLTHSYSLVLTVMWAAYGLHKRNYLVLFLIVVAAALTIMAGERKAWLGAMAALALAPAIANTGRIASGQLFQRLLVIAALIMPLLFVAEAASEKGYVSRQITSTFSAFSKFMDPTYDPANDLQETISNRARIYITMRAQEVVAEHPVFGLGLTRFHAYIEQVSLDLPKWISGGVHNEYLRITAETGFVGLLLYLFWLFTVARRGLICVRSMPYFDHQTRFRVRVGAAMLVFGIVMIAFRASSSFTVLILFLPAAFLYFPARVVRLPNGKLRLASPSWTPEEEDNGGQRA